MLRANSPSEPRRSLRKIINFVASKIYVYEANRAKPPREIIRFLFKFPRSSITSSTLEAKGEFPRYKDLDELHKNKDTMKTYSS